MVCCHNFRGALNGEAKAASLAESWKGREAMGQKPDGQAGLIYLDGKKKAAQTKEFAKEKAQQSKEAVNNGWEAFKDAFKQKPVPQPQGAN